jgi:hypothetical protein
VCDVSVFFGLSVFVCVCVLCLCFLCVFFCLSFFVFFCGFALLGGFCLNYMFCNNFLVYFVYSSYV